jgi:hypothetical protein
MVDVAVQYDTSQSCPSNCTLSVSSNEGSNQGNGHTSSDWLVIDAHRLQLRADRAGGGPGRTYSITVTCSDTAGSTSASATVLVPLSRRP